MIDEGKSLYNALHAQKVYALPDFFLQSLNVAGQSGKMVEVLTNMGNFFSAQNKVKKQVKGAMTYPAIIFTVVSKMPVRTRNENIRMKFGQILMGAIAALFIGI